MRPFDQKCRGSIRLYTVAACCGIACLLLCSCGHGGTTKAAIEYSPSASLRISDLKPVREISEIGQMSKQEVVFLDDKRLLLARMFSSIPENLSGEEFNQAVRSNLVLLVLDPRSGQIQESRQWLGIQGKGIVGNRMLLVADREGGAILGMDHDLLRLSGKLKTTATRMLEANPVERNGYTHYDSWSLHVAASGNPALLIQYHSLGRIINHWISPATLRDESSEPAPNYSLVTLVGTAVVFEENKYDPRRPHTPTSILVSPRGLEPRPLCAECSDGVPVGFGNSLVFVETEPSGSYLVADLNGNILYRGAHLHSTDHYPRIESAAGAANANRIAFTYGPSTFVAGRSMNLHIAVLDADLKKEIWDQPLEIQPERVGNNGIQMSAPLLALSPDGHTLAVLANGVLETFAIP